MGFSDSSYRYPPFSFWQLLPQLQSPQQDESATVGRFGVNFFDRIRKQLPIEFHNRAIQCHIPFIQFTKFRQPASLFTVIQQAASGQDQFRFLLMDVTALCRILCRIYIPFSLQLGQKSFLSPQLCDSLIELSHSYRLVAVLHRFQQLDSLFQKRMPITPELIGQPYECFLNVTFQQQRRRAFYDAGIVTPTVPVSLPSDIPSSKVPAASAADNLSGKRTGLFRCRRSFP